MKVLLSGAGFTLELPGSLPQSVKEGLPTTRQAKFVEMRAPALCHTLGCLKSSQTVETQSGCWCTSKITELFLIDFPGLVQLDHRFCSGCTRGGEMLGEIPQMNLVE